MRGTGPKCRKKDGTDDVSLQLKLFLSLCSFLCLSWLVQCRPEQTSLRPWYKCIPLIIKKICPASASLFLCFQLAEELIYQGRRDEVKELVALFSKPHFKVKSTSSYSFTQPSPLSVISNTTNKINSSTVWEILLFSLCWELAEKTDTALMSVW